MGQGGDPGYVQMARSTVDNQQREIREMERMLAGGVTGGTGEANPFQASEQRMHQQMMAATGGNLAETWARKMITHHQGAVDMSEALISQGGNPQVLAVARRTAEDQRREIAHLEAMLRGEAMPAATAPTAPSSPAPRAAPAAAPKANPRPAPDRTPREPAPKAKAAPAPRPAPRPEPAPAPKAACAPEHRALGHC